MVMANRKGVKIPIKTVLDENSLLLFRDLKITYIDDFHKNPKNFHPHLFGKYLYNSQKNFP